MASVSSYSRAYEKLLRQTAAGGSLLTLTEDERQALTLPPPDDPCPNCGGVVKAVIRDGHEFGQCVSCAEDIWFKVPPQGDGR